MGLGAGVSESGCRGWLGLKDGVNILQMQVINSLPVSSRNRLRPFIFSGRLSTKLSTTTHRQEARLAKLTSLPHAEHKFIII